MASTSDSVCGLYVLYGQSLHLYRHREHREHIDRYVSLFFFAIFVFFVADPTGAFDMILGVRCRDGPPCPSVRGRRAQQAAPLQVKPDVVIGATENTEST